MAEWFEELDPALWLPEEELALEHAHFIISALCLRRGMAVLDCPCGDGRLSEPLARHGCRITGVDLSGEFIHAAMERFASSRLAGRFIQMDMRQIDFADEFDAVVNFAGSFGYFEHKQNVDLVHRYARALRHGGRLIVDQPNRQFVLRNLRPRVQTGNIIAFNKWNPKTSQLTAKWLAAGRRSGVTMANNACRRSTLRVRLYTLGESRRMFESAGLRFQTAYGRTDGSPYTTSSRRLIVVARKM